jgi:hypothetical protein
VTTYLNIIEECKIVILKTYYRYYFSNISLLNRAENSNMDSSGEAPFKSSKTSRGFYLDLDLSIFQNVLILSLDTVPSGFLY